MARGGAAGRRGERRRPNGDGEAGSRPRVQADAAPAAGERAWRGGASSWDLQPDPSDGVPQAKPGRRAGALVAGLSAVALLAAAGYVYLDYGARFEIDGRRLRRRAPVPVAAKASGFVAEVPVVDNQHVAAGDVIARIDDRDYRVALAAAEAQAAAAKANVDSVDAQLGVQQAQIEQSQAQVESAEAALAFAEQQASRYDDLAQRGRTVQKPSNIPRRCASSRRR